MPINFNLQLLFRELSEVKNHDKEVTTQANTAQDEVIFDDQTSFP